MPPAIQQARLGLLTECVTGDGVDDRRKDIIKNALACPELFVNLVSKFRMWFNRLADGLQSDLLAIVATHIEVIRMTLDMIRSENVATESEQNPELRRRAGAEIAAARDAIQRIQGVVGG